MFLYRRGKVYWLGWQENGKQRGQSLQRYFNLPLPVTDKVTANQLLIRLQADKIRGHLGLPTETPPIKDFYMDYFRFCDRNKTLTTVRADRYRFNKWLTFLSKKKVESVGRISKQLLRQFIDEELSHTTNANINRYICAVRASLQWGVREDRLSGNVLKDMSRLTEKRPERRATFQRGDLERLFSIEDQDFQVYLKLIYHTLMRLSEALSLTWDDVDLRMMMIRIRETKTKTPRTVPIAKTLLNALKSLKSLSHNEGALFPSWRPHSVTTKFRRIRDRLGLKIDGIHHFRHLCASELLRRGANPRDVQELLGHRTSKTTMEIYAHASAESLRETVEKL